MRYNFDEVIDRSKFYSLKWSCGDFLKKSGITDRFDKDSLPLFTADMDFRCAKPIQDALMELVQHNIYGYSMATPTNSDYYSSVINWFKTKYGWDIKPEEIIYSDGTVAAVKYCIQAFTKEGDGILINRPIYTPFTTTILETKRTVVNSQLINNDCYYEIDFDDFEKKCADPGTKLFILCNPHNPTGRIWSDSDLIRMAQICKNNGVIIVADEIHGDLIRIGKSFTPLARLIDPDGLVTCTAANKTFNLAGLKATNVVIQDPKLREIFTGFIGMMMPGPFTVQAVTAAYRYGDEWLSQLREYLDGNIAWTLNFLKEKMPSVKVAEPEGTYILWMDFRGYGLTAAEIHDRIYNRADVILENGSMFDPDLGAGFERICLPAPRSVIQEAFTRIAREFE
jgi:cystathionine beta-lyase